MSVCLHVGFSGTGKSHALFRVCEAYTRSGWIVVVVDTNGEAGRHTKMGVLVSGPNGAREAIKRGHKLLIWTAGDRIGSTVDANAAAAFVLSRKKTLLAITEAHTHLPNGKTPPPELLELITRYRHHSAALICDTQRLVQISTILRGNATEMRVFGVVSKRDLDEFAEAGGSQLAEAASECARRCVPPPDGPGEPGWFVEVNPRLMIGPYKIKRFPA